jgi:hypothetical protein
MRLLLCWIFTLSLLWFRSGLILPRVIRAYLITRCTYIHSYIQHSYSLSFTQLYHIAFFHFALDAQHSLARLDCLP